MMEHADKARKGARVVIWLGVTAFWATAAPFAAAAAVAWVVWLVGADAEAVREIVAVAGTADPQGWEDAAGLWEWFAGLAGVLVVLIRVLRVPLVSRALDAFNDAADRAVGRMMGWRPVQAGALVAAAAGILALTALQGGTDRRNGEEWPPEPVRVSERTASAAVVLPDGTVETGRATIEKQGPAEYSVRFGD